MVKKLQEYEEGVKWKKSGRDDPTNSLKNGFTSEQIIKTIWKPWRGDQENIRRVQTGYRQNESSNKKARLSRRRKFRDN